MAAEPNFRDVFLGADGDDLNEYLTPVLARVAGPPEDLDVVATGTIRESNGHASLIRQMTQGGDLELSRLAAEEDLPADDEEIQLDDELFSNNQVQIQAPDLVELSSDTEQSTEKATLQTTELHDVDDTAQRQHLEGSRVEEGRVDLVSMTEIPNPVARSRAKLPASCPICKAGPFNKSFELTSHMRVHTAGDMYCPIADCPKASGLSFKRQCDYARHAVTHDPPDYCCPFCTGNRKVTFNRSDVLNRHMKSHHSEIPKDDPLLLQALEKGDEYAKEVRKRAVAALKIAQKGFDLSLFIEWEQTSESTRVNSD